ncbi:hypothetical protein [uncultured Marivirga sp.]|uniref:glycosyltransferase n=1 Tax=uncultured Marivirga sp. TaxID=1123707 RepID=UPI0030EBC15C|tara:strand:+ start:121016 stop:122086 length:1071 start_codon:yes stop_codon:yes gene_type:complete
MRILLLGDYSGYGVNLKDGLNELGHDVMIASGDAGWKNFPFDLNIKPKSSNVLRYVNDRFFPFRLLSKITGFDIVQFIDPYPFYINYFPRKYFYEKLFRGNRKTFLVSAAMDAMYWKNVEQHFAYTPYNDMKKYDWTPYLDFKQSEKAFNFNKFVADQVDGIIPVMYDYEIAYMEMYKNKTKTIPLAINLDKVKYEPLKPAKKLTFFHSLNSYGFKGTKYIEEAFSDLKKKYPNDIEFVLNKRMPFQEYMTLLQKTHVVVDQVNSYSYGMNALYALGSGKIVMSGAEPEALEALGIESSPVINIRPDKKQIKQEVLKLLDNRNNLEDLSIRGRTYVEKYHGHVVIAQKYLDFWCKF